ncbi:MAG: hypothetical protein ACI92B_000827 [Marinobacter maritimus]|jgi:hypothetical protein
MGNHTNHQGLLAVVDCDRIANPGATPSFWDHLSIAMGLAVPG